MLSWFERYFHTWIINKIGSNHYLTSVSDRVKEISPDSISSYFMILAPIQSCGAQYWRCDLVSPVTLLEVYFRARVLCGTCYYPIIFHTMFSAFHASLGESLYQETCVCEIWAISTVWVHYLKTEMTKVSCSHQNTQEQTGYKTLSLLNEWGKNNFYIQPGISKFELKSKVTSCIWRTRSNWYTIQFILEFNINRKLWTLRIINS